MLQRAWRNVGDYSTIIYATSEPTDKPGIVAMQRAYNIGLNAVSSGQFAEIPRFWTIGCLHKGIEPRK